MTEAARLSEGDGIASTPDPPYFAVIFTSIRNAADPDGYARMAERMVELARAQPGFLGVETAREEVGITVSYWRDLDAIRGWKLQIDHLDAQRRGRAGWYKYFHARIARVERDYAFRLDEPS